ncbi:MAG: hypothetical protein IPL25_00045 [Saprospiraceae bacterium]|nr:hypothetical protein [Candidatus Vicinibacter affinis]
MSGNAINIANGDGSKGDPTITLDIGRASNQVAAGNHTHGKISDDGQIGAATGRIVMTGLGGTLEAVAGTEEGQMLFWNGSQWVKLAPGLNGQSLVFMDGKPTWWPEASGSMLW